MEIKPDGSLVIEWYDYSSIAESVWGNDVAYLLTIGPDDKRQVLSLLAAQAKCLADADDPDGLLLNLSQQQFHTYWDVKQWLENHNIPFEKTFNSWA